VPATIAIASKAISDGVSTSVGGLYAKIAKTVLGAIELKQHIHRQPQTSITIGP